MAAKASARRRLSIVPGSADTTKQSEDHFTWSAWFAGPAGLYAILWVGVHSAPLHPALPQNRQHYTIPLSRFAFAASFVIACLTTSERLHPRQLHRASSKARSTLRRRVLSMVVFLIGSFILTFLSELNKKSPCPFGQGHHIARALYKLRWGITARRYGFPVQGQRL